MIADYKTGFIDGAIQCFPSSLKIYGSTDSKGLNRTIFSQERDYSDAWLPNFYFLGRYAPSLARSDYCDFSLGIASVKMGNLSGGNSSDEYAAIVTGPAGDWTAGKLFSVRNKLGTNYGRADEKWYIKANGNPVMAQCTPPDTDSSSGTPGEMAVGGDEMGGYLYICYATNSWARIELTW